MKSRTLFATSLILLTPLIVSAFQSQADRVRKNELKSNPFIRGPLKITLIDFYYGAPKTVEVKVENTSDDFTTFDPRRLSFIDKDDNQVDILGVKVSLGPGSSFVDSAFMAGDTRIAPKARIKRFYALTDKAPLPARLYYEEKLLGTIIE
jgi:hypothetical protein